MMMKRIKRLEEEVEDEDTEDETIDTNNNSTVTSMFDKMMNNKFICEKFTNYL